MLCVSGGHLSTDSITVDRGNVTCGPQASAVGAGSFSEELFDKAWRHVLPGPAGMEHLVTVPSAFS